MANLGDGKRDDPVLAPGYWGRTIVRSYDTQSYLTKENIFKNKYYIILVTGIRRDIINISLVFLMYMYPAYFNSTHDNFLNIKYISMKYDK